jgi:hypothetical protein
MTHHECDSHQLNWVKYDAAKQHLYVSFKPKGTVYRYEGVPDHHFKNIVGAKKRTVPVGMEKAGSEGSYVLAHVVGNRKNPPYPCTKLTDAETRELEGK